MDGRRHVECCRGCGGGVYGKVKMSGSGRRELVRHEARSSLTRGLLLESLIEVRGHGGGVKSEWVLRVLERVD